MQLTKQQKIYAAVLLLGGVALGVDRFVIGHGPEEAAATPPAAARPSGSRPRPAPPQAPARAPVAAAGALSGPAAGSAPAGNGGVIAPRQGSGRSLATRLQEVVAFERLNLSAVPDAFRPSRRWDPPDMLLPPPPVVQAAPQKSDVASQFRTRNKLNAVLNSGSGAGGFAIINGKMFRLGQHLDDLKLVALHDKSVDFEGPAGDSGENIRVKLIIPPPQPAGFE